MSMFKNLKNLITNNSDDSNNTGTGGPSPSPSHQQNLEDQHSAEGFLCPLCMTAFASPDALKGHYDVHHSDQGKSSSNESEDVKAVNEMTKNLQLEVQELQQALTKERICSTELVEEFSKMQDYLNSKDKLILTMKAAEKDLRSENALLGSDVKLLRQQLGEQLEQLSIVRKDKEQTMVNLTSEMEEIKKDNASLKLQLAHRNSVDDTEVLKQELVSVQKMMNEFSLQKEEEVQILKTKIDQLNTAAQEKDKQFVAAQIEFCEKLKDQSPLELQETQTAIKLEQYKSAVEQSNEKIARLETEREELEGAFEELRSKNDEFETAQIQIIELNKNIHNLKLELMESKNELAVALRKVEIGKEKMTELEGELEEKNGLLGSLHNKFEENVKSSGELERKLKQVEVDLEISMTDFDKKLNALSEEKALAEAKCKSLDEDMARLTNALTTCAENTEELREKLTSVNQEKKSLEAEFEKAKVELKNALINRKTLDARILELEAEAEKDSKEREALGMKFNKISQNLQVSLDKSMALHNAKKEADQKIKEQEERENELNSKISTLENNIKAVDAKRLEAVETAEKVKAEIEGLRLEWKEYRSKVSENENIITQIKTEIAEYKEKNLELQTQYDTILVEKLEFEKTLKSSEHKNSILMERCLADSNEKEKLHEAMSDLKRKLEDSAAALHELGRENQTLVMESHKLSGRQWTDDSLVTNCVTCSKEFTLTNRKHHCRHCGQIFCKDCSSKTAKTPSSKNPVRVCDACFEDLMAK